MSDTEGAAAAQAEHKFGFCHPPVARGHQPRIPSRAAAPCRSHQTTSYQFRDTRSRGQPLCAGRTGQHLRAS